MNKKNEFLDFEEGKKKSLDFIVTFKFYRDYFYLQVGRVYQKM